MQDQIIDFFFRFKKFFLTKMFLLMIGVSMLIPVLGSIILL